jgi:hypothetical protein
MLPGRVIPFTEQSHPFSEIPQQPPTVVLVGRDSELLSLRARVIGDAGYVVQFITPDHAAAELRKARSAQLWVFCQTLEFYDLLVLAVAIRRSWPQHKLVRLTGFDDIGRVPGLFDESLEPVTGVDDLLRVIGNLAKQSFRSN